MILAIMTAAVVSNAADDSASELTMTWQGSWNYRKAEETPQTNGLAITGDDTEW